MPDARHAAMVVVPSEWTPEMPIGLSEETHERYFKTLQPGMRILIYKAAPVNAIVGEGEIIDHLMVRVDEWPHISSRERPVTGTGTGKPADYILPLRILYERASLSYIDLPKVRDWVEQPEFPDVEWQPISSDAYEEFTNWP